MNQILPQVKPNPAFRSHLEKQVIAEFHSARKRHTQVGFWLQWLIPAASFIAVAIVISSPLVKKQQQLAQNTALDTEMNSLEQQLISDHELDAAINFEAI